MASISVDGGSGKVIDLYGTTAKASWWTQAFPTSGPHTVVVRRTGQKNKSSTSTDAAIDGVAFAEAAPQPASGGPERPCRRAAVRWVRCHDWSHVEGFRC